MRIYSNISFFAIGSATLAFVAGCSTGGSGIATQASGGSEVQNLVRSPAFLGRNVPSLAARPGLPFRPIASRRKTFVDSAAMKKAGKVIAVSDDINSVVDIFTANGHEVGQLTEFSFPAGMASDIRGDLYVTDMDNSRIAVYGPGLQGKPKYLIDPGQYPGGVDSFANGKYVAVTNLRSTTGGFGSVSIFKGSTLQTIIKDANLSGAYFCAFDSTGNLFVSGRNANDDGTTVGEIAGVPSGGTTYKTLTTGNQIQFPGAVQVTTSGQVVIDDQGTGSGPSTIYTYNLPSGGSLGSPVATTPMTGSIDVITFAFSKSMTDFYAADAYRQEADAYAYPAGGAPLSEISIPGNPNGAEPIGVAVLPSQHPMGAAAP